MPEPSTDTLPDLGDSLDEPTFKQILEMDDDDDFSRSIVFGFFEQAETTFVQMASAIENKELQELSSLGHFLKGSSAIIGLTHIKSSCEKIQHLGHSMDETGQTSLDSITCLRMIKVELEKMRTEYARVEKGLRKYFDGWELQRGAPR